MATQDRSAVLTITARAPFLVIRLGIQYLRSKRTANKARSRFYNELISNGLPRHHAKDLADQYASVISVKSIIRTIGAAPISDWLGRSGD